MAAGLWGYNYHLEELVYADAGYVELWRTSTLRNRGRRLRSIKEIEQISCSLFWN